jgi:hypothetical protein
VGRYLVRARSNPEETGTVSLTPASPDGYYTEGALVTVTATPNQGYAFLYRLCGENPVGSSVTVAVQ